MKGGPVERHEIRYTVHTGPFKETSFLGSLLGIGHDEYFYLLMCQLGRIG